MEHHIVDAGPPKGQHDHRVVFVVLTFGLLAWGILMLALSQLISARSAFILFFVLLGLAALLWLLSKGHMRYLHHRRHSHDINVEQRSQALTERAMLLTETLTLERGFSASMKLADGREMTWTSPLTIPHAPINIKEYHAGQPQQLPAPLQQGPDLETIIQELRPNALEFAYGYDPESGQLVKATLPKAVHIQLVGASGQGKSRQATSILTQLCSRNDPQHLQLALIDHEGETSAPFWSLPHTRYVADDPKEAAKIFRALVKELDRRDIGRIAMPVILMFCEEFLNLRRSMPPQYRDQALEDYTTLALRGRKRGMFLFSIGQTAYSQTAIRDAQAQFLSSMAFALKPTAARSAGFTNTELLNRLYSERKPGQFLLERPAGDAILLAPYVDTRVVSDLLGVESGSESGPQFDDMDELSNTVESGQQVGSNEVRNQSDSAQEAKSAQVCQLLVSGVINKAEIIQAVWDVKPGSSEKYRNAEQEYKAIMREIAKGQ